MTSDQPVQTPTRPQEAPEPPDGELARDLAVLRGGASVVPVARRSRTGRRLGVGVGILAVLALLGLIGGRAWLQPPEVSLVAVALRDLGVPPIIITASGPLEAKRQITLSSKAQGKIVEMPVEENQVVRTGDLIARLENEEQTANYSLADAEFDDAARDLERRRGLHERGTASRAQLDSAATRYRVTEARRELARATLANSILLAPIDGTIIRKIRDVGEFLTIGVTAEGDPGTAVVTLADLSALDVSLQISETEIRKVKIGAPALVTPESAPELNLMADVIEVAAMADRNKGIVQVKVRLRNPDPSLLPDMTAKVRFLEYEPESAIETVPALPASAVTERDGISMVFVARQDVVEAVPVSTVPIDEESVALVEGLEPGSYVVDSPPPRLAAGDRIRVRTP